MQKEEPLISALINHHFCIKGKTKEEILNFLAPSFSVPILFDHKFDWDFLFDENIEKTKKRFLLFDKINDWNYLQWNVTDFEETKKMTLALSRKLNMPVYYFFIDPWAFTCRWVLADKGKLVKSYCESNEQILNDEGSLAIEHKIRTELKMPGEDEFWEDKFWELYESICQPIEIINEKQSIWAVKGELKST